jgi:hypothetical protein
MGWIMKRFHSTNIKFILSRYYRGLHIVADCYNLMTLVLNDGRMRLADAPYAIHTVFVRLTHNNSPAACYFGGRVAFEDKYTNLSNLAQSRPNNMSGNINFCIQYYRAGAPGNTIGRLSGKGTR